MELRYVLAKMLSVFFWAFISLTTLAYSNSASAACTGTARTWNGSASVRWDNTSNWDTGDIPDTAGEDAIIVSAARITRPQYASVTIGCFDLQSGLFRSRNNKRVIVTSDLIATTSNTMDIRTADTNFVFEMGGSSDQEISIVDTIQDLDLNNPNTITSTLPFAMRGALSFTQAGTFVIDANLTLESTTDIFTIPSGATVEVTSGNTLTALGGVIVNGTLKVQDGASLVIGNGQTLQVNSGGIIQLNGASGNTSTITGNGADNSFTFNMAGQITADYFRIDRLDSTGLNVTGTISAMDNGEFHYLANAGHAITLGAAAVVPATLDSISFFDDDGHGNVKNIDASSYNVSNVFVDNWSGSAGGAANETDSNNRINWGSSAGTKLTVSDNTAGGNPPSTISPGSSDTLFATFAFSLTQSDTATDIDSVVLTMSGTASSSDIDVVKVYKDDGAGTNCVYDAGTDTQVGSDLTLSGSPPSTTVNFSASDVQTSSDTDVACFHVVAATSSIALDSKTIQFKIDGTSDVDNSEDYDFSDSSGPPVSAGTSTITNTNLRTWRGKNSTVWNNNGNWLGGATPTSTVDCLIGSGTNNLVSNVTPMNCQNWQLITGGTFDFNSTTNEAAVYGALDVESGYTFSNASSGVFAMRGAVSQSLKMRTTFPGNLLIANTGTTPNDVVNVNEDSEISGNVTVSSGVLKINSGVTLTVVGNLTVQSGATLEIAANGTLEMGDGSTLTVDSGGTLTIVGSASQIATVTSNGASNAYNVVVNGTIEARYYNFDHLNTAGVSIESGASIDATNYMQNGTFSYPVNNSTTMLFLKRQIPGNTLSDMSFSSSGSGATGITNIDTTGASAGTLTVNPYSGDLAGLTYHNEGSYLISWAGAVTTVDITQEATGPAGVNAGSTYNMGRFGFQQADAGASFSDIDIDELTLTLTGTGSASDVSEARIFYDSDCNSTGGTEIGSGTFSGNPATVTFNISASDATVEADASSPPLRCIYVEYDIDSGATDGKTVGVKINQASDFSNDLGYAISGTTSPPINLGTAATISGSSITIWTGNTDTDWFDSGNWSAGVPDSTKTCEINNVANDPVIDNTATAACYHTTINSGALLTFNNGDSAVLEISGNLENAGTITQNDGTLRIVDGGANQAQTVESSSSIDDLSFNLTGNGTVTVSGTTLTLDAISVQAGSNFDLVVPSGKTLEFPNGLTISEANFVVEVQGGGTLEIGNGQTLTVSGGTFKTTGTNDGYPQSTANKGKVTVDGAGTWSFNATSGTVSLVGFIMDYLSTSGMVFSGTTTLSALDGGQLTNLSTSYSSVTGFQFNTSNIPATASYIGWNWGPDNTVPATSENYTLAASTGCGSNTISFDQWFGDFFVDHLDPDTSTKVSASSCTINIAASASPVSLIGFTASPYDEEVSLDWETGLETNHQGFNVYRSLHPYTGYTQINNELVRNSLNYSSFRGKYHFLDKNVENGQLYYYMIEDIAINGATKLHGPVSTIPLASLGKAPTPDSDTNSDETNPDETDNDPTPGDVDNPSVRPLGNGAFILAQTQSSIRLLIEPPTVNYTAASWNGTYTTTSIAGYGLTLEPGYPELPERVILLEVDSAYDSITSTLVGTPTESNSNYQISPAPHFTPDSDGALQASYLPDPSAYSSSSYVPSSFYEVETNTHELGGKHYIKIVVNPLLFRGSDNNIRSLTKLTLDISLDGQYWQQPNPSNEIAQSPSAAPSVLRIKLKEEGFYRLSYSDFVNTGTVGPFEGVDLDDIRMYHLGEELSIEITSADDYFNSGDQINFYYSPRVIIEDKYDEVVLSPYPLDDNAVPYRINSIEGDPTGSSDSGQTSSYRYVIFEENKNAILDRPHGGPEVDHFYWDMTYDTPGGSASAKEASTTVSLPGLDSSSPNSVRVSVEVRAIASFSRTKTHKIALYLNNMSFPAAEKTFEQGDGWETVVLDIPSSYFANGDNQFIFKAVPEHIASGDWITININKFRVDYVSYLEAINDVAQVLNQPLDNAVEVSGFTSSDIKVYDTSEPSNVSLINNVSINTYDAGITYNAKWEVNENGGEDSGYRYHALTDSQYKSVEQMYLNYGFNQSLKDTNLSVDLVIIGEAHLIDAAHELIAYRQNQGYDIHTISPEQIYAEFSHGVKSSFAIRDFFSFAKENWQKPPKYALLIGDGTYDPQNIEGYTLTDNTFPVPFEKGIYTDFGSDNWFVTEPDQTVPYIVLGRIPTNDPNVISNYAEKVIAYEYGNLAPSNNARKMKFYTDLSESSENFEGQANMLMNTLAVGGISSTVGKRGTLGDAGFTAEVTDGFNDAPLMITYIGHGAESMWADDSVFGTSHAESLNNPRLPIVMALNCLNARFEEADPESVTIGEKFILNSEGGAIAFLGSTTLTTPGAQAGLATAMYNEILSATNQSYHDVRIGDVMLRAKTAIAGQNYAHDIVKSYTILGDPLIKLPETSFKANTKDKQAKSNEDNGGGCGVIGSLPRGRGPTAPLGFILLLLPMLLFIYLRGLPIDIRKL